MKHKVLGVVLATLLNDLIREVLRRSDGDKISLDVEFKLQARVEKAQEAIKRSTRKGKER